MPSNFREIFLLLLSKSLKRSFALIFPIVILSTRLTAQGFSINEYNNEDGLLSNLVKDISRDEQGYIWAATDGGIVRFDGKHFLGIPLNYAKKIRPHNNSIYYCSDTGLGRISETDGVITNELILKNSEIPNDSSLHFSRLIYIDSHEKIWIAEQSKISQLKNNALHVYETPNFYGNYDKSAFFFENKHSELMAFTITGIFLKYDEKRDAFRLIKYPGLDNTIISSYAVSEETLLLGTTRGVIRIIPTKDLTSASTEVLTEPINVSCITKYKNNKFLVSTYDNGLFIYDDFSRQLSAIAPELKNETINTVFYDTINDVIFLGTNTGLKILKEKIFDKTILSSRIKSHTSDYISFITPSATNSVVFTDQNDVFILKEKELQHLYHGPFNGSISSITASNTNIFIALTDGSILVKSLSGETVFEKEVTSEYRIGRLYWDTDNKSLWGTTDLHPKIFRLDSLGRVMWYDLAYFEVSYLQSMKKLKDGFLYFLAAGKTNRLLKFNYDKDVFSESEFPILKECIPTDFTEDKQGNLILTSDKGAFIINRRLKTSQKLSSFPEEDIINIKAVAITDDDRIWLGAEKGLYCISGNDYAFFSRNDGLSHPSITYQGIVFQSDYMYIATAKGVSYCPQKNIRIEKTSPPVIYHVFTSSALKQSEQNRKMISGANLNFKFSSLHYPLDKVLFQVKLEGFDNEWNNHFESSEAVYPNLAAGKYIFKVKAKKPGYLWSDVSEYKIEIIDPWYSSKTAKTTYILLLVLLVLFSAKKINDYRNRKLLARKNELEQLVAERTAQLQEESKELLKANEFKSQLLSIAAHDLKNPLQTILGYEFLVKEDFQMKEEELEMADSIFSAAKRMLNIISELLESAAANSTVPNFNFKEHNLADLAEESILNNAPRAKQKSQRINFTIDEAFLSLVDAFWIKEALDNLLSNAIKYSSPGKPIDITLYQEDGYNCIKVKDYGPGLTEDDKSKLFTKFQRLSATPTGGESSTGLGLYIVKDIVEKHGGKIEVESIFSEGAAFIVMIPAASKN